MGCMENATLEFIEKANEDKEMAKRKGVTTGVVAEPEVMVAETYEPGAASVLEPQDAPGVDLGDWNTPLSELPLSNGNNAGGGIEEEEVGDVAEEGESQDVPAPSDADSIEDREFAPDTIYSFSPEELIIDQTRNGRSQIRSIDDPDVKDLAKTILAEGQMQPGEVVIDEDGKKYVNFGFGRVLAVQRINSNLPDGEKKPFLATVRYIDGGFDITRARLRNVAENLRRKDLSPLDMSVIAVDLTKSPHNLNKTQIAEKLGVSKSLVTIWFKVADFPEPVKQLMREEKIGRKAAVDLCALPADEIEKAAMELAESAGDGKVTARAVKKKSSKVAPSSDKKLDMKEFLEVLDWFTEPKQKKELAPGTKDFLQIIGDICYGKISQAKALTKLAAYK